MAQYIVPQGKFTEIVEASGTIQNTSRVVVEISDKAEANTGIRLYPQESRSFGDKDMPKYARAVGGVGPGVLHVVSFMETLPDGGITEEQIATDEEINDLIDEVYGSGSPSSGGTSSGTVPDGSVATDEEVNDLINEIYGGGKPTGAGQ